MKHLSLCIIAATLSLPAQALVTQPYNEYLGRTANWDEPANWSLGHVPTAQEDVLIDGDSHVVIDPALASGNARHLRDLLISGRATLETLPGVVLQLRNEIIREGGQVIHRSSGVEGDALILDAGMILNPTSQAKRTIVLQSSATVDFGIGGREPASLTKTGAGALNLNAGTGYYATMVADVVVLGSNERSASGTPARTSLRVQGASNSAALIPPLRLSLHYGFVPRARDTFQIITVNQLLVGQFPGMPEGALVGCTPDNLGFYISYVGGDGNDVVLTARDASRGSCARVPSTI